MISNRNLSAKELLYHARTECSLESMHWLLDMHFRESFCTIPDKNVQQTLNILRKMALYTLNHCKTKTKSKETLSKLMFSELLDVNFIRKFQVSSQN